MLPYLSTYGARRFQSIHLICKTSLYLPKPRRSQSKFSSTESSHIPNSDHSNHNVNSPGHRRLRFQSDPDEASDDPSPRQWASEAYNEGQLESQHDATGEEIGIPPASKYRSERDTVIKAEDQAELKHQVLEALHDEDPHRMLEALTRASRHPQYFENLPTSTLSEIIHMLQPSGFIDRERAIYQELRTDYINDLGHGTPQLSALFESYADSLGHLLTLWRKSGKVLGLKEYKALLRVACAAGNGSDADRIWHKFRQEALGVADTEFFNLYMEAKCWDGTYTPGFGHTLRIINRNLARRSQPEDEENTRRRGYEGFTVGTFGLRAYMTKIFDDMIHRGLNPDANTFMHLMVAMGREGDIAGVKSVLKNVWAIDVGEITGAEEAPLDTSTTLSPTSPLYPSERLLFMVAHIFGSNNDVSTALRVVDYISNKYNTPVDLRTWQELFSWTYLLSQPRSQGPEEEKMNLRVGQLPSTALSDLWKIIRSPPYNAEPTMTMHFQRVSNLQRRAFLQPMLDAMREMRDIHEAQVQRYKQHMTQQVQFMFQPRLPTSNPHAKLHFSRVQQEAALAQSADLRLERLAEYRDFTYLRRALGFLLKVQRWTSRHGQTFYNVLWQRIGIHNAVTEFGGYLGRNGFWYKIRTGTVSISPINLLMAVNREKTALPGVDAISGTDVYHATVTKYKRYGALGNMEWDHVSFEHDEEDLENLVEDSWPTAQAQRDLGREKIQHELLQHDASHNGELLDDEGEVNENWDDTNQSEDLSPAPQKAGEDFAPLPRGMKDGWPNKSYYRWKAPESEDRPS